MIGFSFLASAFATQQVSELAPACGGRRGVSVGVHLRSLARSELFTENTLVPVIPFLEHRDRKSSHGL